MLDDKKQDVAEKVVFKTSPKMAFTMGILAGLTLASLVSLGMMYSVLKSDGTGSTSTKTANTNTAGVVAGAQAEPTPTPTAAAPSPTKADIELRADDHVRGDKNAKVTLVEYSDFECPFCARYQPTLEQILNEYEGQVNVVYRHYPLSFHPQAQKAGEASECAADQGQFWEMHDQLFVLNSAGTLSLATMKTAAGELGLNQSTFDNCLDNGDKAQTVKDELAEGSVYGVNGTPATFVNGELVSGAQPFESFKVVIDNALAAS